MHNFEDRFKRSIKRNLNDYMNQIVDLLIMNENAYLSVANIYNFYKFPNDFFDLEEAISVINESKIKHDFISWREFQLFFNMNNIRYLSYEESMQYDKEILRKVYEDYRVSYFATPGKLDEAKAFSDYYLFLDRITTQKDANKLIMSSGELYNIDDWCKACFEIFSHFFYDFIPEGLTKKGIRRFSKKLVKGIKLNLEYDEKEIIARMRRGSLTEPNINLILCFENENEHFKTNFPFAHTIELGSASNYFFGTPFSPETLYAIRSLVEISTNNYLSINGPTIDILGGDLVRVYNSCKDDAEFKHQLFYYFDVYSYYSKYYISFIEKCVLEAIN